MTGPSSFDWRIDLESRFGSPLRRFFGRRLRNQEEAVDLTQELFVRVLANHSAAKVENPDAYIFATASNLIREKSRRAAVRGSHVSGAMDMDIVSAFDSHAADFTPERIMSGRNAIERAIAVLDELGETTRAIFILHRIEGMKQKHIAQKFEISVSAVEKHIAKALVRLAKVREP